MMSTLDMYLRLTEEDVAVLRTALDIRLENLRFEVARTHDHDYREALQHQLDRLEKIGRDLQELKAVRHSA